jgi:DNA-binding Lrp family transcriptional regulator
LPRAYILINTEIGSEREVLSKLRKTAGVEEAFGLMGVYDIIARVRTNSTDELNRLINRKFSMNKVHSKLTVVVTET